MNKKGFTLIELLTVVVILALLALISVPKIVNVVEKARRESAKSSAIGYVRSIETKVATSGLSYENKDDYAYDEIKLNAKGEFPTGGLYSLYEGKVTNATFCILGYIIEYNGSSDAKIGEKCTGEELKLNSVLKTDRSAIKLTYPKKGYVEIIENLSNGQVTCETSDPKVATCDISNKTLILKPGTKEGYATITLTSEATSKYKEAKTAVVAYTEEGLLSITANGYTGVYDGLFHGISVTSPGATIKYGLEQGTYDLDKSPTYSEVGEYTVYYEVTKEGYKPVRGSKTISITKAEGSVTAPTAKTLTYNGSAQELINAGSSTTGTIQYKLNNGSYLTSIPTATNPGTYTVYYRVIGDSNHNDVEEKSIDVTIKDQIAPTCQLAVTSSGVSFEIKNDNYLVESYGMNKTGTEEFNSANSLPLSTGTFYGYVKDTSGNVGSCSATISTTITEYTKTYKYCIYRTNYYWAKYSNSYGEYSTSCQESNMSMECNYSNYGKTRVSCNYGTSSSFGSCSSANVYDCRRDISCNSSSDIGKTSYGTCTFQSSLGKYICSSLWVCKVRPITEYCTYNYIYYFGTEYVATVNSCENNDIVCNSNTYNQQYVSCSQPTYKCNSGTKLNDSYCYKIN